MSHRNFPLGRQVQVGGRFTPSQRDVTQIYRFSGRRQGRGRKQGLKIAVTSTTLRTTVGTQNITVPGFGTPKTAIVIGCALIGTAGVPGSHQTYSFGATDGTNQWCIAADAEDAQATTDTSRIGRTDEIAIQLNVAGATVVEANFVSFIDDGMQIAIGKNTAAAADRIVVILLGGNNLTAAAGVAALGGLGATVTVTPGIETNALLIGNLHQAFGATIYDIAIKHLGLASYDGSTIRQCCLSNFNSHGAANGDPSCTVDDDKILAGAAATWTVSLSNITTTEFDLTSNGADLSAHEVGYLALNVGNHKAWAGVVDSPTAEGSHEFTNPNFRPIFGLMLPTMMTAVDTDVVDDKAGTMGLSAFTANDEWCWCLTDEDIADPSNTSTALNNQAIDLNGDDQSAVFDATFDQFTTQGAKLNFTAADGTVRKWPALFLGL